MINNILFIILAFKDLMPQFFIQISKLEDFGSQSVYSFQHSPFLSMEEIYDSKQVSMCIAEKKVIKRGQPGLKFFWLSSSSFSSTSKG